MKRTKQQWLSFSVAAALAVLPGALTAQGIKLSDGVVKIGILTDLSGLYSDIAGAGSITAAKMAVEDFQAQEKGRAFPIELVYADHQNKGDVASNKAREWFERDKVDMIGDLVTTSTALAVMPIAKQMNRITIVSGAASTLITGKNCTDTNIHYVYDTYALANGTRRCAFRR